VKHCKSKNFCDELDHSKKNKNYYCIGEWEKGPEKLHAIQSSKVVTLSTGLCSTKKLYRGLVFKKVIGHSLVIDQTTD